MSLKRTNVKSSNLAKVAFKIEAEDAGAAESISVVGDFNGWDAADGKMKKNKKDGSFSLTLELEKERQHQFRYLIDGVTWANEADADDEITSPYGSKNSVLNL